MAMPCALALPLTLVARNPSVAHCSNSNGAPDSVVLILYTVPGITTPAITGTKGDSTSIPPSAHETTRNRLPDCLMALGFADIPDLSLRSAVVQLGRHRLASIILDTA